jgi:hypothetical protein
LNEQKQVGNATIAVVDDEFFNGYQTGYLRYITEYRGKLLADTGIYAFIAYQCLNIRHTDRWNSGYVTGWFAALFEKV